MTIKLVATIDLETVMEYCRGSGNVSGTLAFGEEGKFLTGG